MASAPAFVPEWRRLAGVGAPVVVGLAVLAARPEIVRGSFSSGASALRVGGVFAGWLGFSWLVHKMVRSPVARAVVVGVPAAALLWLWVVPYFVDETVEEAFPAAVVPSPSPSPVAPALSEPVGPVEPAPPAGPVKVSTGQFRGLAGHRGSGEAAIYRQPDGSHFVRLEDFEVSNGPGIVLHLVPGTDRDDTEGGVKLGALRGNRGSQNFAVPAGTPVDGPLTLLIWCEPFAVPMAGATQAPA